MKKIMISIVAAMSAMACISNYEMINGDPFGVTDDEMQRDGYAIRAALTGIANGVMSPDINTTQFSEALNAGPLCGYFASANSGWKNTTSNYNPTDDWTNVLMASKHVIPVIYTNYKMIREVTDDPIILAVADIVKVAAMHRITDAYGPIPYTKIGADGDIKVAYDSQETVYRTMFDELNKAIEALTPNRTNSFSASADIIYGGNVEKWIRLANSLKLRLAMRVSKAAPDLAKEMAESAINHEVGVFISNDDNAMFTAFGSDGNPLNIAVEYNMVKTHEDGSACTTESGDTHAAADIICYMNGYNDPRRDFYFTQTEWTKEEMESDYKYCGLRHGIEIPDHKTLGHKYSGVKIGPEDPLVWINAAEVAFLKAEAALYGWNVGGLTAKECYEEGIRLSFAQWGAGDASTYIADNLSHATGYKDPAGLNDYEGALSTITIAWEEDAAKEQKLERIITQKWIANWRVPNEAWADMRRTGYPIIIPASEAGNKSNGIVDSEKGASRLPYPASEAVTNPENYQYAVQNLLGGPDNMATELWFAKN